MLGVQAGLAGLLQRWSPQGALRVSIIWPGEQRLCRQRHARCRDCCDRPEISGLNSLFIISIIYILRVYLLLSVASRMGISLFVSLRLWASAPH